MTFSRTYHMCASRYPVELVMPTRSLYPVLEHSTLMSGISLKFGFIRLTHEHMFGTISGMETAILTRAPQLAARLIELDSAIAGLQLERFHVLAEMRFLDESEGKSERQTAVTVAQLTRSSSRYTGAEVRLATKVAALPEVAKHYVPERFLRDNLTL
jgi:hypothetical protein